MKRMIALLVLGLIIVVGSAGVASAMLIAHFEFEDNLLDSSGNALDGTGWGTLTFAPSTDRYLAAGLFGQALSLDTAPGGAGVWVGDNPLLDVTSLTLMAWVRVTSFGGSFLSKSGAYHMQERDGHGEAFFVVQSDPWHAVAWDDPAGTTPLIEGTGLWHHIAGTYDAATGVLNYFVDGMLVATATGTAGDIPDSAYSLNIVDGGTMLIDEVRIYNRALTLEEINAVSKIPEPATMILLGIGLSGLAVMGKKKRG